MAIRTIKQQTREKRTRLREIAARMRAIADGDITDEQRAEFDALKDEVVELQDDIRRLDCDYLDQPATTPVRHAFDLGEDRVTRPTGGRRMRDLFPEDSHGDRGDFRDLEEFMNVLRSGRWDPRLENLRAASGMVGSEGGLSIPQGFASTWLDDSLESEVVRPRARVFPMPERTLDVPGWDGHDHSSTLAGGLTAAWEAELGTLSSADPKVRQVRLAAKKLYVYSAASAELMDDGQGYADNLGPAMIRTLGFELDDAFLNGDGAGKPLGVMSDPAKIEVSKEVGQTAASIVHENCAAMYARLHPSCVENSVWVVSPSTIPQLLSMHIDVGTGGSHFPLMKENSGEFFIFGRPVVVSEKSQAVGTAGDIILADFSQYGVGLRLGMRFETSIHALWSTDAIATRAVLRADGCGLWKSAITPKRGTDTLSWIVSLETRS